MSDRPEVSAPWPEVTAEATPATVDDIEAWLFAAGALSVTCREPTGASPPVLEPLPGETPLWATLRVIGLFSQTLNETALREALQNAAEIVALASPDYRLHWLTDRRWERAWMADFQPMQFGSRLWICPTHLDAVDPCAITLRLDPGLAFGTGTHPTTGQCLEWLGASTGETLTPLSGQRVVDYGCGSGVLAIAAALLGASAVLAIDIDEQALQATRLNAAANGVAERVVTALPAAAPVWQADLVLANILYQPLLELADHLAGIMQPGGHLVMAGMLESQVENLLLTYTARFRIRQHAVRDGWALLAGTRRFPDDSI